MTQLFVGNEDGYGPVFKILKDDADDPLTTSSAEFNKFLFDSKTTKLGYIDDIHRFAFDATTYPFPGSGFNINAYFTPSGSNVSSCGSMVQSVRWSGGSTTQVYRLFEANWDYGFLPIVEVRYSADGIVFDGPGFIYARKGQSGEAIIKEWGYVRGTPGYDASTSISDTYLPSGRENYYAAVGNFAAAGSLTAQALFSVFPLPARNVALPNFATTPVAGQEVLRISPTMTRLALPGRTVASTDLNHFIFHENKIPAKIIKAGDVSVAAGATVTVALPIAVGPDTYIDFHVKNAADTFMYHPPRIPSSDPSVQLTLQYWVSGGNTLNIKNTCSTNEVVRYLVLSDDNRPPTSGGSKVYYEGNDGVRDFIQVKRPGSSDIAPVSADIIVDTRFAYLPLVDEGFLNWPGDFPNTSATLSLGEKFATKSFVNTSGFLPFVKMSLIFSDEVAGVVHKVFTSNFSTSAMGHCSSDSCQAVIKPTSVDFYMSGDNPYDYNSDGTGFITRTPIGLRYYIFGIPQSL